MKAVILAGGSSSRIDKETDSRPKPMVEIGGRPLLWHILKIYSAHGIRDFIVCCGYKGYLIKEYFANYFLHMSDVTFDMSINRMAVHQRNAEPWRVTLVDTGEHTLTGGCLKRVSRHLEGERSFCFTYGDNLANINAKQHLEFHQAHGKLATILTVQPPGRFGAVDVDEIKVSGFTQKPRGDGGWINAGFFVLDSQVIDLIEDDSTALEEEPLAHLAASGELVAYPHCGFWQQMNTLRDKNYLEEMWLTNKPPWKSW